MDAIHLLLGNACNKRCPYCLQDEFAHTKKADFDVFEEKFRRYVAERGLTANAVHYWGGEPLLYRKTLYRSVGLCDELFPGATLHRITTNGTLVDDDYVAFCNANPKVHTVVSIHEFEIPDENWRMIGRLERVSVSGVVHKGRPSPYSYYEEWRRACSLAGKPLHIGLYPIHATDGADPSTWLTKQDVDAFFAELLFVMLGRTERCAYSRSVIANFQFTDAKYRAEALKPKCFNDEVLSIDLFGNQFACHHNNALGNRLHNIFEGKKYIPIQEQRSSRYFDSEECRACPAFPSCHGGCYLTNTHDVECYWNKTQWAFEEYTRHCRNEVSD